MAKDNKNVYSDINKVSYRKFEVDQPYTTHLGVRLFAGVTDKAKNKDGKFRKGYVFYSPDATKRKIVYSFEDVSSKGYVLKPLEIGMHCDYKGYLYIYEGYESGSFIFSTVAKTGETKYVNVKYKELQYGHLIINQDPKSVKQLANLDDKAHDYEYKDFGVKVQGARKDLYNVTMSEIARLDGYVRDQLVTRSKVIGENTASFWQDLYDKTQDKELVAIWRKIYFTLPKAPVYSIDDASGVSLTAKEKLPLQLQYVDYCRKIWNKATSYDSYQKLNANKWLKFMAKEGFINLEIVQDETTKKKSIQIVGSDPSFALYRPTLRQMAHCSKFMYPYDKNKTNLTAYIREKKFLYSDEEKKLANYMILPFSNPSVKLKKDRQGIPHALFAFTNDGNANTVQVPFPTDFVLDRQTYEDGNSWFVATTEEIVGIFSTEDEAKQEALNHYEVTHTKTGERKKRKPNVPFEPLKEIHRVMNGKEVPIEKLTPITTEKFSDDFNLKGGEYGNWVPAKERRDNTTHAYWALSDLAKATGLTRKKVVFKNKLYLGFGSRGVANAMAHYEVDNNVINMSRLKGAGCLGHEWFHAFDYNVGKKLGFNSLTAVYESNPQKLPEPIRKAIDSIRYAHDANGNIIINDKGRKEGSNIYLNGVSVDAQYAGTSFGYWSSVVELFARAGHCYLEDKLAEINCRNDYLNGTCNRGTLICGKVTTLGTEGAEREYIKKCFDDMFEYVKENKLV